MEVVASHLGLATRDINVLTSLFGMLVGTSRSKMEVLFVNLEKDEIENQPPDILFINEDDYDAVYAWNALARKHPYTVPVFVCTDNSISTNNYVLKRPIMLRNVIATIQNIANLKTSSKPVPRKENRLNVLVVDDSFPVRKYMECTIPSLVDDKFSIDFAVDGKEALNIMEQKPYDLVFLDVIMPGIDGYKVCKSIKAKHRAAVVMLTSKKSPFDKVRGTMSGCNAYVTKPPLKAKLKLILEKCIKSRNNRVSA